jgi:hypothetical protein
MRWNLTSYAPSLLDRKGQQQIVRPSEFKLLGAGTACDDDMLSLQSYFSAQLRRRDSNTSFRYQTLVCLQPPQPPPEVRVQSLFLLKLARGNSCMIHLAPSEILYAM